MSASGPPGRAAIAGSPVLRFLLVGGGNTVVTTLLFYALSFVMDPALAFALVYVLGIVFVTVVTPRFVFRSRPPRQRRAALAAWYVVVLICGLAITRVLDRTLDLPHVLVVLGTVSVTAPMGFLGARAIVGRTPDGTVPG
jgi:putative flippase GtrA